MNYFDQIIFASEENASALINSHTQTLDNKTKKALFKRNVELINLELSYRCNRKCDYCPVSFSSRNAHQLFMSNEILNKICQELQEIRYENRISLNLYNEPLLDNNLEEKISLIKKHLPYCHIAFNSNGDKLNFNRLKTLSDAGCDYICVTLHPPAKKEQDLNDIKKRLSNLCKKLKYEKPEYFDIERNNFIQFRSIGINIKIQWPDWHNNGTNRAGILTEHISKTFKRSQPCAKPFREFTIYYDGKVQPCCEIFHDTTHNILEMGDLSKKSIFDIYCSEKLSKFRMDLFDFSKKYGVCEKCNVKDYSNPEDDVLRKKIIQEIKNSDYEKKIEYK